MTTSAIYSFVSRFAIPKKKIKRQVFYSKKHVDIAKDLAKAEPEYYTTAEAMEKYNLTRDQLYHYDNHITRNTLVYFAITTIRIKPEYKF